jgi:aspartate/methionine/tyrosine aminotransferase
MAADGQECRLCSVCQVSRPAEAFSKKQFKAKAHERTCLVCAGLSKETGAPGIRIGDTVLLHSLQAQEYNGLIGVVTAALNGL